MVQRDESTVRLQLQLQQAQHKCAEFERQVLNSRDHALGQAAEIERQAAEIERQEAEIERQAAEIERQAVETERQAAEIELQVLNSRDHALGQAAEIGALRFRIGKQAATFEQRLQDLSIHIANHLAHISRLESAHMEANQRANVLEVQRQELLALRSSTTWKIGRFIMLPVRMLKRLTHRG